MASKGKGFKKQEGTSIVSVIGDEDTVTGFLLAGIGERNIKGETNFLVVDSSNYLIQPQFYLKETPQKLIQDTFKKFLAMPNCAIILVTQQIAEKDLRHLINEYDQIIPTILEIPSKDLPYEPKKVLIVLM